MRRSADRYIDRVLERVVAPADRVGRLRADLEGHFAEAAAGDTAGAEADVIHRLGPPEEVAASFMADVQMRFAGFWIRLFAFFGDLGIGFAALMPLLLLCAVLAPVMENSTGNAAVLLMVLLVMVALSAFGALLLYFPLLEHFFGTTYGKRALKLRVVTEEGAPISLGAAFLRRLSFFFELLWLDALFVPFTAKKQRAFDIVAKTVVVHDPDEAPTAAGWFLCLAPWTVIAAGVALAVLLTGS